MKEKSKYIHSYNHYIKEIDIYLRFQEESFGKIVVDELNEKLIVKDTHSSDQPPEYKDYDWTE